MDAAQLEARLQAIEEERRQLLQEQQEQEPADVRAETHPNVSGSDSGSTTRRELWALAREMMEAAAAARGEGAGPTQLQQQQQPRGDTAGDEGGGNLSTLREAVRLVEAIGAVAALPPPATLLSSAATAAEEEGEKEGTLLFRLPALVEQHLAARARLEALLEAEQRARPRVGGGSGSTSHHSPSQRLLAALLRLVRAQARALRERALWAARHQALAFPSAAAANVPGGHDPAVDVDADVVVASLHRRPRHAAGGRAASAGLVPLFLALERLQAASAGSPLPLTVTEDPRERRRAASPRSPRGAAGSLGPPPSQLHRLLADIAHALVDRAVLPALAAAGSASLRLTTRPGAGGGEVMSLHLAPEAAQGGAGQDGGGPLGAAMAAAEAAAGFVCEGLLDGEPWWAEDGAHRPLLAPLVDPLVAALGEAVADGLLRARPQDDEAARALLRPLLPPPHHGQQQQTAAASPPQQQQQRRSLALQRLLERVAVRALSGPAPPPSASGVTAATAAAVSTAGPFNVREAHARAWALGRSQELLAGAARPKRGEGREEAEDALAAWRGLLQEACAAPSPAVAPPALLACIPREVAALAAALGNNNAAAAAAAAAEGGLSPGRRQEAAAAEGGAALSPHVRKGLAEALLAFGHRQGRAQQQLQGGVGGRDWSAVDVALKLRPAAAAGMGPTAPH